MIIGMASFTVGDMCVKLASQELPSGQVMIFLGLGCTIVFAVMLKRSGEPMWSRAFFERSVMLRNTGEVIGAYGMFTALHHSPLSTVTAITQTLPLLLTVAAVVVFKEKVGKHRIAAVLLGFIGTLIVIRPGISGFDQYSFWALIAVVGLAMRDVGSRLTQRSISSLLLSFYSACTLLAFGCFLLMLSGGAKVPTSNTSLILIGMIVAVSLGFLTVTQSMRIGEVSVVSPFRYVRLLFAALLGVFILGEAIDNYTIIGSLITILAGIYIWLRENKIGRAKPAR